MNKFKISVIGLGYVGFPVFFEFSKKFKTIGFDINKQRIESLKKGIDTNKEFSRIYPQKLNLTSNINDISNSEIFIITVPTPIDKKFKPDLAPIKRACKMVGKIMKKNSIIVFESTVFPGCTENVCVPLLEKYSNLKFNKDFYCGYSPERINVGDARYGLTKIKKIISASNKYALKKIKIIYKEIIKPKLYIASSIQVAESAKLIENIQRDINIALVNELSVILRKLNIDTTEVLEAASTKWNFHKYFPGLVGGHCIGVDPYYLSYLSKKLKYKPKVLLAGREMNENMSSHITGRIKVHIKKYFRKKQIKILILGFTFKENCNDIRNTKVFNIYKDLKKSNLDVDVYDPHINKEELLNEYNIIPLSKIKKNYYDYCLLAVRHKEFVEIKKNKLLSYLKKKNFIYDLKGSLKFKLKNYEKL